MVDNVTQALANIDAQARWSSERCDVCGASLEVPLERQEGVCYEHLFGIHAIELIEEDEDGSDPEDD